MPKQPFVFNDETVENSYGFSILTAGIGLSRFKNNPVMLDSHWNNTSNVLGSWDKVKKTKGLLTGRPVFDSEDKDVKKIEGKVDRGFVKSCSMGISFNREDLKLAGGKLILTKCELYEVSIVAIPSNANSIRLYVGDNETPLTDEEVQELCLSITDDKEVNPIENKNENLENMKIKLEAAVCTLLGVAIGSEMDQAELNAKLLALGTERDTLKTENSALELKLGAIAQKEEQAKLAAINLQVETAVKEGRITADKSADFVNLGISNPELLTSTLAGIPAKASLSAQVETAGNTEVKTIEDFQKLDHEGQLSFKTKQPELYKKLFTTK